MATSPPSPPDPLLLAKVGIVMSLELRPGALRVTADSVVTGKLAGSPSDSDGKILCTVGYVNRHGADASPQCLSFTFNPGLLVALTGGLLRIPRQEARKQHEIRAEPDARPA